MSTLTAKIQLRRDTSANWTTNNPILAAGEVAFTSDVFYTGTDQQRFKIGDGVQTWTQLDYVPEGGGGTSYPENLFLTVINKTTDNLLASEYKVLKVITAQGGRLAVDYALADSDANSADTIGVVYENIDNNQEGRIITIGEITGINTTGNLQGETWADGDSLFLSDTIDGGITNVRPTAPNHGVRLGYVVNVNANNGKIYVKIDNGYELSEIHDVYAPSPNNNEGIFWSSGTNRYENRTIETALGYTPENLAKKGVANGYAPLESDSKIDAAYLPSYVSDVLEYANLAAFPVTGASNKIYVALDTNKVYRWSGSVYIEVSANSGVWGAITGTITNQTDLVSYVKGYSLQMICTSTINLADNTTYFIGSIQTVPFATDTNLRLICPKSGTIKTVVFSSRQTFGTGESSTLALGVNGSYTNISTGILFNSNPLNNATITGLSRSVNAGDYITLRLQTATWVTNPLGVSIHCIIYIE
jgi:hypothetical protein